MSADLRPFADPVRTPGYAVIVGERLLPAVGCWRRDAPVVTDLHRFATDHVIAQEHAAIAVEAALHRLVEDPREPDRRPPDPPDPGLRVEQPEREPLEGVTPGGIAGAVNVSTLPSPPRIGPASPNAS